MKDKIKCPRCKREFEVDLTKVNEDYIQCPLCGGISINNFKESLSKELKGGSKWWVQN